MPSILSIPTNEFNSNKAIISLSKEGLIIDPRVIFYDHKGWKFELEIERRTLRIRKVTGSWNKKNIIFFFRIYDPAVERVPAFNSKSYIYNGLDNEQAPCNVEEVSIDPSVRIIKQDAFADCKKMRTCKMGDNIERIEKCAFHNCISMRNIILSRNLRFIGYMAFHYCTSLDALFLSSSVEQIEDLAFWHCRKMRSLMLPANIDLQQVGDDIVKNCNLITKNSNVTANLPIPVWLKIRYDNLHLHRTCTNPHVTAQMIYDTIKEYGTETAYQTDIIHNSTPLHVLINLNAFAASEAIIACSNVNPVAILAPDKHGLTPLDYLWKQNELNVIIDLMLSMCMHKQMVN